MCPSISDLTSEDIDRLEKYMQLFEGIYNKNDILKIEMDPIEGKENEYANETIIEEIECEDEQIFLERLHQLLDFSPNNSVPVTPYLSNSVPPKSSMGVFVMNEEIKRESICNFFREAINGIFFKNF